MSIIRFSSDTISQTLIGDTHGNIITSGTGTMSTIIAGSAAGGISLLLIYGGTPATFPQLTDRATRASDLLISFTLPGGASGNYFTNLGIVNNSLRLMIGRHLHPQVAAASGLATWFILCRAGTTSMTDKGALIGSIGVNGSGEDLEIPDRNIIAGNNYQCAGFYVNFPQSWPI